MLTEEISCPNYMCSKEYPSETRTRTTCALKTYPARIRYIPKKYWYLSRTTCLLKRSILKRIPKKYLARIRYIPKKYLARIRYIPKKYLARTTCVLKKYPACSTCVGRICREEQHV
jgi:hypothetical protein